MPRFIKPCVFLNAAVVAAACLPGPALAQPAARPTLPAAPRQVAQPNAALVYWPAWDRITPDMQGKLREIDWEQVGTAVDVSSLPASYRDAATMEALFPVSDDLVRASRLARCDFEVRYDDGFMALLPHLGKTRDGSRLLRLAAHQRLTQGRADDAAQYLAAIARTAGHVSGDRVLISSLVGFAIATAACDEVGAILHHGGLTEAGKRELLEALKSLDTEDPMHIRATLAFEGEVIPGYVSRRYTGPRAGSEVAELLRTFNSPGGDAEGALVKVSALDEAGLKAELARVRKVYEETYVAWDLDKDVEAIRALSKRTAAGEFGPLASVLCPSLERAFLSAQKFRATLRATIEAVERYTPAAN